MLASLLGCRQAVRHQVLILTCGGSNPSTPATIAIVVVTPVMVDTGRHYHDNDQPVCG